MEPTQQGADPHTHGLETTIQEFLQSGMKSGNYQSNLSYVLTDWREDMHDEYGISTVEGVTSGAMADYAREILSRKVKKRQADSSDEDGLAASTARTYYDYISAFLEYCRKHELLDDNPAQKAVATDELPERPKTVSGDQQFWSGEQRQLICRYADRRASDAIDTGGSAAVAEIRDRALVYVIGCTGVRGGEVLADPRDDRRNGLLWGNVDIEAGTMTILGKNQQVEPVQLPPQTHSPLEQLRRVVEPADDWPVFVSLHAPSMYARLPEDFVRPDNDDRTLLDHCRDHNQRPPALSTNGARSVMKRLTAEAEIDVEGDKDYLTLHGARRGIGEMLYRKRDAEYAQRALRHQDPKTTSEMYSHIDASERADDMGEVLEEEL